MTTLDRTDAHGEMLIHDFDAAQAAFLDAFDKVPDAALAFRPEGDDYALSGLLLHVASPLEHYAQVLAEITAADFGPVVVTGGPAPEDAALAQTGIAPGERAATLARIKVAHAG